MLCVFITFELSKTKGSSSEPSFVLEIEKINWFQPHQNELTFLGFGFGIPSTWASYYKRFYGIENFENFTTLVLLLNTAT